MHFVDVFQKYFIYCTHNVPNINKLNTMYLLIKTFRAKATLVVFLLSITSIFAQDIQRVRIDFTSPSGAVRQILLGFTPDNSATDGFDYGYDAPNWSNHEFDLNWMIQDYRYLIQGVGAFEKSKMLELGMFMGTTEEISIGLNSTENFDEDIDVYLYDAELDTYHPLSDSDYLNTIEAGEHLERFFITFSIPASSQQLILSNDKFDNESVFIRYLSNTKEISVSSNQSTVIKAIELYDMTGKLVFKSNSINKNNYQEKYINPSKGVYIINVITANGVVSKSVLI